MVASVAVKLAAGVPLMVSSVSILGVDFSCSNNGCDVSVSWGYFIYFINLEVTLLIENTLHSKISSGKGCVCVGFFMCGYFKIRATQLGFLLKYWNLMSAIKNILVAKLYFCCWSIDLLWAKNSIKKIDLKKNTELLPVSLLLNS